jgi:DNA mismatch endonuclease, patch repair protein
MVDIVKPEVRSRMMSGIRGKDTQPELLLRRGLFARGIRFRLHVASLPGRPDIVIPKHRVAILIHGCFWHAHKGCKYFRLPGGNRRFWAEKLGRNRKRDVQDAAKLQASGWRIAIVWECATRVSSTAVLDALFGFLRSDHHSLEILATETPQGQTVRIVEFPSDHLCGPTS